METYLLRKVEEEIVTDLKQLIQIPSLPEKATIQENAPFGKSIRECFDCFSRIAYEKGFLVEDDKGYAIDASFGEQEEYIGILGHLDIVDAGDVSLWNTPPYKLHEENGMLFGRGVNDDKGPLLAALYAAWILKEQNLPLRYAIHIIAGGAEETTWKCMAHYFSTHKQPIFGFSPDGDFPIVNGEKGILQVCFTFPVVKDVIIQSKEKLNYVCDELYVHLPASIKKTYIGKRALSRNPQRGENAIFSFVKEYKKQRIHSGIQPCVDLLYDQFLDDFYGQRSSLFSEDDEMGTTSVCPMSLTCNASQFELYVDIRYVKTTSYEELWEKLQTMAQAYGAVLTCVKHKRLLYVDEQSIWIQSLKKAYFKVMGVEANVLTKGGASYARVLDNGIAFGATFPGEDAKPHMPNECMPIESLLKTVEIYYEALYELVVDHKKANFCIDEKLPQ